MSKPTPYENRGNTRVIADLLGVTHDSIVKAARKLFYDLETDSKVIEACRFVYMDGNGRDNLCFLLPPDVSGRLITTIDPKKGIMLCESFIKFIDDPESFNKYWARLQDEIAYNNIDQRESAFEGYEVVPEDDESLPTQQSMDDGLMIARLVPWDIDQDDNQTYRIQTMVTPKGIELFKELFKK